MSLGLKRAIRGALGVSGVHYSGGLPYSLAFHALYPSGGEMTDVISGTGGMTTVHAQTLYAIDHEDVYRPFAANEPVYSGVRTVTNIVTHSEDITNADWTLVQTDIDATTWEATSIFNRVSQLTGTTVNAGDTIIYSADIQFLSGDPTVALSFINTVASPIGNFTPDSTLKRYSFTETAGSTLPVSMFLSARTAPSVATRFKVTNFQIEVSTGRTDTTTPSEYIATTTAAVTKHFTTENGNSVASNVVTEGTGAALTGYWLNYIPAITNSMTYSRDLSNAAWGKSGTLTATYDQVGIDGVANSASLVSDVDNTLPTCTSPTITVPNDSNTHVMKVWIKKDSDETRFPEFRMQLTGGTAQYNMPSLNTSTGATSVRYSLGTASHEVIDDGDWWVLLISLANNSTGNTSASIVMLPAFGSTIAVQDLNATGSIIVGNVELHLNKSLAAVRGLPPTFTTTAAVSTAKTTYSFDTANHGDNSAIYAEMLLSTTGGTDVGTAYLNAYADGLVGKGLYFVHSSTSLLFRFRDGASTTCSETVADNVQDSIQKIGAVFHLTDGLMDINRNGTYKNEQTYTSSDAFNPIEVGSYNSVPFRVRNLRRYNINNYAAGKSVINGLMA